ncbi:Dak phosphatase [Hyaloscypha bicolor E]|uniref:Dak phosphatase n=1 Tax=Hyaloscypha bicolor E TaxID=1095630 RepID=A0A2J6SI15_9HELO|nr:Dak phosphatase [Hyaloscypha bicolor E]PMD50370.1 Dak phosphatase [Hyaloscypha bicolor E]
MSVVVEQTLPYTAVELKLEDPTRWARLFPLMRPSIKVIETTNEQTVVVDTALAGSKNVLIAAIGSVGNFSSKMLSESHLAAFTTERPGNPTISAEELQTILKDNGFPTQNGVVVLRSSTNQKLRTSRGIVEFSVEGEVRFDHVLSLLSAMKPDIKLSLDKTQALLEHFANAATRTTSTFRENRIGNGPSVSHSLEIAEFKSAKSAVDKDLGRLLSSGPLLGGDLIYSIHCSDINGFSRLENNILAHELSEYLANKQLASHTSHSTILDRRSQARGWAISLCAMPSIFLSPRSMPTNSISSKNETIPSTKPREGTPKIQLSDSQVRKIIITGCERVIKEEPTITEYDTIVGDGDCGYTLRDGAKQVLSFIRNADLSKLPSTLSALVDDLEVNMGGTSGALYCIFFSSLAQNLWDAPSLPAALKASLDHLLKYTRARLGDRTCLDCLIPFVDTLVKTDNLAKALAEARKGVETTKKLEAKLGRSSYLDESATRGVPDPGAYGLLMLLEGMASAP